jgi:aspartate/methionine/tyrosine aminotransferase
MELAPLEKVREIRKQFVDHFVVNVLPTFPNQIRAVNQCVNLLTAHLSKEGFGKEFFPLPATIGDVDPFVLGFNSKREPDPFEERYADLADRLALDPEGPIFLRLQNNEREIRKQYKNRGIALTRYNPQGARGTEEVRNIVIKEAKQIGLEASPDDVWMGYGGGDLIQKAARSVNVHFINKLGRPAVLLTPTVGFTMAIDEIKDVQVKIEYLDNSDLPRNELTAERLVKYQEEVRIKPDMVLLTPANNPNAEVYDPDTLRDFLNKTLEINKEVVFIFDMAYMWMISREKAIKLMQVIKETGADQRAMFVNSLSKKAARPGSRIGSIIIPNKQLGEIFHRDNMRNVASWSGDLDVLYQALDRTVDETAYSDLVGTFRQRQKAMLNIVNDLDPQKKYFNLDSVGQEVPLYLWVKLQEGINAFDILKDLNIAVNPSKVFGPENEIGADKNHIRASMGFASTYDILSRSPQTLQKWLEKLKNHQL